MPENVKGHVTRGEGGALFWTIPSDYAKFFLNGRFRAVSPQFTSDGHLWQLALKYFFKGIYVQLKMDAHPDDAVEVIYAIGVSTATDERLEMKVSPYVDILQKGEWTGYHQLLSMDELRMRHPGPLTVICNLVDIHGEHSVKTQSNKKGADAGCLRPMQLDEAFTSNFPKVTKNMARILKLSKLEKENLRYRQEIGILKKKLDEVESSKQKNDTSLNSLSTDFYELLNSEKYSDVVLKVQETEFRAHRAILAARSPVLFATFNHNSEESQTGVMSIPDCDPESFHYFLQFLYSAKMREIPLKAIPHLYSISDKYNVQELKKICSDCLRQSLTSELVCEVAVLADLHFDDELMTAVQQYFTENYLAIIPTAEWSTFMKKSPRVADKLLKTMVSAVKKSQENETCCVAQNRESPL